MIKWNDTDYETEKEKRKKYIPQRLKDAAKCPDCKVYLGVGITEAGKIFTCAKCNKVYMQNPDGSYYWTKFYVGLTTPYLKKFFPKSASSIIERASAIRNNQRPLPDCLKTVRRER